MYTLNQSACHCVSSGVCNENFINSLLVGSMFIGVMSIRAYYDNQVPWYIRVPETLWFAAIGAKILWDDTTTEEEPLG